jgi:hypothetical protein
MVVRPFRVMMKEPLIPKKIKHNHLSKQVLAKLFNPGQAKQVPVNAPAKSAEYLNLTLKT